MSLSPRPPPQSPTSCLSLHCPLDVVCTKHGLLDLTVLHQVKGHHEGPHGILPLGQKDDLQREKTRTITRQPPPSGPWLPACGESTPVRGGQLEPGPSGQSSPLAQTFLERAFHRERPDCSPRKPCHSQAAQEHRQCHLGGGGGAGCDRACKARAEAGPRQGRSPEGSLA